MSSRGRRREGREERGASGLRVEHATRGEQTHIDGDVGVRGLQQEREGGRRVLHHGGLRGRVDRQAVAGSVVEQTVGLAQRDGPGELDGDARAVGEQTQRGERRDRENLRGLLPRRGLESEGDAGRRGGERDFAGLVEEKTPENAAGGRRR